jgi:hypothetical protein
MKLYWYLNLIIAYAYAFDKMLSTAADMQGTSYDYSSSSTIFIWSVYLFALHFR